MTRYLKTFLRVFRNSLLNLDYYRDLLSVKFGFSLKYFFTLLYFSNLFLILPILIGLLTLVPELPGRANRTKSNLVSAFPRDLVVKIQKGQLSINKPQPYFYDGPSEITAGKHLFAIDTVADPGSYKSFNSVFLVTKNSLVVPNSESNQADTQTVPLSDFQDSTLDYPTYTQAVKSYLPIFDNIVPIFWISFVTLLLLGPVVGAIFILPFKLFHLLIVSIVLLLLARIFRLSYEYSQLYRLAIHASTLPIIFFTLLELFGLSPTVPFGYSLLLLIFVGAVLLRLGPAKHNG